MGQTEFLNFLNEASLDDLQTVRGIGPALAGRILAARPFTVLEDLQSVSGVNANVLQKLSAEYETRASLLSLETAPVAEATTPELVGEAPTPELIEATDREEQLPGPPEAASEIMAEASAPIQEPALETMPEPDAATRVAELVEIQPAAVPVERPTIPIPVEELAPASPAVEQALPRPVEFRAVPKPAEKPQPTSKPGRILWAVVAGNVVTAFITILLTLAILAAINGSLKFATSSQYRILQREAAGLSTQVEQLGQDMQGLRARVDTLEGFGERTVALEKAQLQLNNALSKAGEKLEAMRTTVDTLKDQVTAQEKRTLRFEKFLKQLQELLSGLFTGEGGNP